MHLPPRLSLPNENVESIPDAAAFLAVRPVWMRRNTRLVESLVNISLELRQRIALSPGFAQVGHEVQHNSRRRAWVFPV